MVTFGRFTRALFAQMMASSFQAPNLQTLRTWFNWLLLVSQAQFSGVIFMFSPGRLRFRDSNTEEMHFTESMEYPASEYCA